MAQRAVHEDTQVINPVFDIQEDIVGMSYDGDHITVEDPTDEDLDTDIDIDVSGASSDDDTDYTDAPETPQIIDVFSQTDHMDATGTEVVDVVFDVTDVFGITNYEIRVVKA